MTSNQIAYRNALTAAEQAQAATLNAQAARANAESNARNATVNEQTLQQRQREENRSFWSSLGSTLLGIGVGLLGILL